MSAICHPGRQHKAKGLCASCYRRERYRTLDGKEQRRGYYLRNSGRIIAKTRAYYHAHRVEEIAKAVIRNRRNRILGGETCAGSRKACRKTSATHIELETQASYTAQKFWWKLETVPRWWEEIAA